MSYSHVPKKRKVQPIDVAETSSQFDSDALILSSRIPPQPKVDLTNPPKPPLDSEFVVMKFGGSSVGTGRRLAQVLDTIQDQTVGLSQGVAAGPDPSKHSSKIAVVVSAQGNVTDWLLEAADRAAAGELVESRALVDRITEHAITSAFAALSVWSAGRSSAGSVMPSGFVPAVRNLINPLNKIFEGMAFLREKTPQGLDYALSFGERLSALVLTCLLEARGVTATFVDARTWVFTDAHFGAAKVDWVTTQANVGALHKGWGTVSVHTGFIGQTNNDRTTTLGRNGSDYTATLLGAALKASRVVINTDVPGVMTADPAIVKEAMPVNRLTFEEALALGTYGARLFHARTFFPLMECGVPMVIRNTMDLNVESGGTLISAETAAPGGLAQPTCVTSLENLAMVELRPLEQQTSRHHGLGESLAKCLAQVGATVYLESQAAHGQSVLVVVPIAELDSLRAALNGALEPLIRQQVVAEPSTTYPVTMLSVVLENIRETPEVAQTMVATLGALGVSILAVSEGPRSFTCVIAADDTPRAVRGVHSAYNLSMSVCSTVIIGQQRSNAEGSATMSTCLATVLGQQRDRLERQHSVSIRVVGVATADGRGLFDPSDAGIPTDQATAILSGANDPGVSQIGLAQMARQLAELATPLVVDCSGRAHQELYELCLSLGVSVVISSAQSIRDLDPELLRRAKQKNLRRYRGAQIYWDSSIGGTVPVLSTIRTLRITGDRIVRIECALSASVNTIAGEFSDGSTLSEAVARAASLRYLEPDMRTDLLGEDFASKLLVLAQELGLSLTREGLGVVPFIDAEVFNQPGDCWDSVRIDGKLTAAQLARLQAYDSTFGSRHKLDSTRLAYVGTLVLAYGQDGPTILEATITPRTIANDNPLSNIRKKQVFIALTTEQHHQNQPLIMYGAGQGGV